MTGDQPAVFGILSATQVLFVWGRWCCDLVARLLAMALVMLLVMEVFKWIRNRRSGSEAPDGAMRPSREK